MPEHFISRSEAESDLLAAAAFLGESITSADGHAEAMLAIVPMYLAKGNVDLAAELANQVDEPFLRDKLLTAIAVRCAEIDDDEYAQQLAEAIEDEGMREQAFERVALVKASSGQLDNARDIAAAMRHPDFVLGGIAVALAAKGEDVAVLQTLESIEFPAARAGALQQIAFANIESGSLEKAAERLDLAAAAAGDIEHAEEKIRSLCETGNLFVEAKRNDKAIESFDSARELAEGLDNIHRDSFLVASALGFLHAGSTDLADRTLDLVTDKTQMATALLGFAREAWKKDEKDDAVEALDEATDILMSQRDIETRDSRARSALMASIAAQYAGFEKAEKALDVAGKNQDPDEQISSFSQIAQILTIQNHDGLARETINRIGDEPSRAEALIAMSDAKVKADKNDEAVALLKESADVTASVPQLAARSNLLHELAVRFADHGQSERARELALSSFDVISEIRDESSQAVALGALSGVYETAGLVIGEAEIGRIATLLRRVQ